MEAHEKVYRTKRRIFVDNFVGGIAWGLGATLGLAVILTILGFVGNNINLVPFIGEFIADIIWYIQNDRQMLQ